MANLAQIVELIRPDTLRRGEQFSNPCSNAAVAELSRRCCADLGLSLPTDYGSFLLLADGINYNGATLFAASSQERVGWALPGVVEENLGYRLDGLPESVLFVGTSGGDLYGFERQAYVVMDAITLERVEHYASFEELAQRVLAPLPPF